MHAGAHYPATSIRREGEHIVSAMKRSFTRGVKLTFFNYSLSLPLCTTKTSGLPFQRPSRPVIHWLTSDLYPAQVTWHTAANTHFVLGGASSRTWQSGLMASKCSSILVAHPLEVMSCSDSWLWFWPQLIWPRWDSSKTYLDSLQKKLRTCNLLFWCTREQHHMTIYASSCF